jgi:2-oxoglutarate dehydrogenase E1 component
MEWHIVFEYFGLANHTRYFEFEGKDYDKEYFDGDVKYHLGLTINNKNREENQYQLGA